MTHAKLLAEAAMIIDLRGSLVDLLDGGSTDTFEKRCLDWLAEFDAVLHCDHNGRRWHVMLCWPLGQKSYHYQIHKLRHIALAKEVIAVHKQEKAHDTR